jgi:hypothetical protein
VTEEQAIDAGILNGSGWIRHGLKRYLIAPRVMKMHGFVDGAYVASPVKVLTMMTDSLNEYYGIYPRLLA